MPEDCDEEAFADEKTDIASLYSPLFFTNAPFIKIDEDYPEIPALGHTALIRSCIFAAYEAFAKNYPDIAYKYIPKYDFLTLFANLNRRNGKALNGGIFFKKCRIVPTDKGLI